MRIAQVAPLHESVPPALYGGTERVVSFLAEELVAMGHDVTVFASGDSRTSAELVVGATRALRLDPDSTNDNVLSHHLAMLSQVSKRADQFDIVHFHTDPLHYLLSDQMPTASVTTLHGRLDLVDTQRSLRAFRHQPHIAISASQRRPVPWLNVVSTVHHGLPANLLRPGAGDGGYLAFLGRMSPEKRPDLAIEIARRAGVPLRMAAKVDEADRAYFEREITPLLDDPLVEFIGEVGEGDKAAFLGGARALLFPIDWPEPFGLVMIEALACGTPVIAAPCGSVPEVIEEGVTGFVVASVDEAAAAVQRLGSLSRERCRARFEQRFTARRMAETHELVYQQLIEDHDAHRPSTRPAPVIDAAQSGLGRARGPSGVRQVG